MTNLTELQNLVDRFHANIDFYKDARNAYNEHSCRTARTLCRKCNTFLGKYKLIEGVGENGGYHAQVFMSSLFSQMDFS